MSAIVTTITRGSTSQKIRFPVQNSSVTTGAYLSGLAYNTASLTAYYYLDGSATGTAIPLVAGTVGTWTSGGFVALDATNATGVYELDLPSAALASGNRTVIQLQGASNMTPVTLIINLVAGTNVSDIFTIGNWTTDGTITGLSIASGSFATGDSISNSNCHSTEAAITITPTTSGDPLSEIFVGCLPDIDGTHFETPSLVSTASDKASIVRIGGASDATTAGTAYRKTFNVLCKDVGAFTPYIQNNTPHAITATITYRHRTSNTQ